MGIAMKHRVEMENLDYIQIHPTTLYSKKPGRRFLVSESVRGEGALLYDKNGQRFTNELQPRDLLSQKIFCPDGKGWNRVCMGRYAPSGRENNSGTFSSYL